MKLSHKWLKPAEKTIYNGLMEHRGKRNNAAFEEKMTTFHSQHFSQKEMFCMSVRLWHVLICIHFAGSSKAARNRGASQGTRPGCGVQVVI